MEPQRQSHILKQKTGPDDPELQANLHEALAQVSPEDVIAIADELAERHARLFLETSTALSASLLPASASWASSFADIASAVTHTKANARTLTNHFAQTTSNFLIVYCTETHQHLCALPCLSKN
jgi:hypothetical protein